MRTEDQLMNAALAVQGHGNLLATDAQKLAQGTARGGELDQIERGLNLLKRDVAFMELTLAALRGEF